MRVIKQSPVAAGIFAEPVMVQYSVTFEMSGDLDRARKELEQLVKAIGARGGAAAEPRMELARIAFRRGDFSTAKNDLNSLMMADPGSASGNEAVAMLSLLNRLGEDSLALRALGQADLLILMRNQSEGRKLLDSLTGSANPTVREEALWLEWQVEMDSGELSQALLTLGQISSMKDKALRRDRALYETGRLYQKLGDLKGAIASYEALLQEYPDSPLSGPTRRRSRELGSGNL
jgi:tetratricopeptide (TPR) repeat protein